MTEKFDEPQWDVPGWDWDPNDYSWLSSKSGVHKDGVSIFFIHGGRIRHQGHIKYGSYSIEDFVARIRELAEGLDDPYVAWLEDTGGGDPGLWVEGTRPPNDEDLERLRYARQTQEQQDKMDLQFLRRKHPNWFKT